MRSNLNQAAINGATKGLIITAYVAPPVLALMLILRKMKVEILESNGANLHSIAEVPTIVTLTTFWVLLACLFGIGSASVHAIREMENERSKRTAQPMRMGRSILLGFLLPYVGCVVFFFIWGTLFPLPPRTPPAVSQPLWVVSLQLGLMGPLLGFFSLVGSAFSDAYKAEQAKKLKT